MRHIKTTINGERSEFLCEDGQTLLEALRDVLQMTGTKEGCGTGDCGACSVIFNGRLVCSCLVLAAEAEGGQVQFVVDLEDVFKRGQSVHYVPVINLRMLIDLHSRCAAAHFYFDFSLYLN